MDEIDMHSPSMPPAVCPSFIHPPAVARCATSLNTGTGMGTKRARSPGPGSPTIERQAKRISLAGDANNAACHLPHLLGLQHPQPLSVPHRFLDHVHVHRRLAQHPREEGPDDWVRQTGELSVCAGNGGDATRDQGDGVYGENMVVDLQSPSQPHHHHQLQHVLHRPTASRSHFHSMHISARAPHTYEEHHMSLSPFSLPTPAPTPTPTTTAVTTPVSSTESSPPPLPLPLPSAAGSVVHPPTIYFFPAMPSADTCLTHANDYGFRDPKPSQEVPSIGVHTHEHQPPRHPQASGHESQIMLSGDNTNISVPMGNKTCMISSVSSSGPVERKKRFTMGPRVDCVKCRMGVKGHWVHLD